MRHFATSNFANALAALVVLLTLSHPACPAADKSSRRLPTKSEAKEQALRTIAATSQEIAQGHCTWSTYYNRAAALHTVKRSAEALADLDKAIALAPQQVDPLILHATIDCQIFEDDDALKYCTLALKLPTPRRGEVLLMRSHIYQTEGKYDLALKDLKEDLRISPNDYNCMTARQLGVLYQRLGSPKEAVEHLSYALKVEPTLLIAHQERADAYMQLKNYKAAIADYGAEMKLMQMVNTSLYLKRAAAYKADGQLKLAAQDEANAKKLSSDVFQNAPFKK